VNTLGLILIMGGALLVWAGLTDNSIIELLKGILGKGSSSGGTTTGGPAGASGGSGRKH
jgi:hypothetical protein